MLARPDGFEPPTPRFVVWFWKLASLTETAFAQFGIDARPRCLTKSRRVPARPCQVRDEAGADRVDNPREYDQRGLGRLL